MAFEETLEYAFFEGRIVPFGDAKISIGTHALQYGTGAFAGVRGYLDGLEVGKIGRFEQSLLGEIKARHKDGWSCPTLSIRWPMCWWS